ncbi:MAG: bifunctional riboflavin kinase/FMN adenylyltransferase [Phycisphaerales bacterium JB050]
MTYSRSVQEPPRTVVSIGSFDGVHVGHRALIERARSIAGDDGRVVALAFFPHPMSRLRPEAAPGRLTDFDQRCDLLREEGADEVLALEPTPELLGRTPEEFVDWVCSEYSPCVFVEGPDFRFGRARAGDNRVLRDLGERKGFRVEVVDEVEVALADQSIVRASSTVIRWLLEQGRVADASTVLGRSYEVCGIVRQGDQRGRLLGYPTANVETGTMLPRDGVYAGEASLPDGTVRAAAIHIGPRATFDRMNRTMEVFVIDWNGPLAEGRAEYGWPISVRFRAWLRDQAKYDSAAELCVQMSRDVERATGLYRSQSERAGV